VADPEIWKVEQTEDNISAPMLFIANAYSDLYVFCTGKRSPAEKNFEASRGGGSPSFEFAAGWSV